MTEAKETAAKPTTAKTEPNKISDLLVDFIYFFPP
jgi:hypothetical protein